MLTLIVNSVDSGTFSIHQVSMLMSNFFVVNFTLKLQNMLKTKKSMTCKNGRQESMACKSYKLVTVITITTEFFFHKNS
jgi:hypothetical protein